MPPASGMISPTSGFLPRNTMSSDRSFSTSREADFRRKNGVSTTVIGGAAILFDYTLIAHKFKARCGYAGPPRGSVVFGTARRYPPLARGSMAGAADLDSEYNCDQPR